MTEPKPDWENEIKELELDLSVNTILPMSDLRALAETVILLGYRKNTRPPELNPYNKILEYCVHDDKCLCSQWRQGRPTKDGGYETLFGYGKNEKWYQRGEEPKCSCGLKEAMEHFGTRILPTKQAEISEEGLADFLKTWNLTSYDQLSDSHTFGIELRLSKAIVEYLKGGGSVKD